MAFISTSVIGKRVILTEEKRSCKGYFEIGTEVTITEVDSTRGYTFVDADGNQVIEAGFSGFKVL